MQRSTSSSNVSHSKNCREVRSQRRALSLRKVRRRLTPSPSNSEGRGSAGALRSNSSLSPCEVQNPLAWGASRYSQARLKRSGQPGQSVSQPAACSRRRSVSQPASQPVSQSASQPVSQSASQPVSQSAVALYFCVAEKQFSGAGKRRRSRREQPAQGVDVSDTSPTS